MNPKQFKVHENVVVFAFRYALGRQSTSVPFMVDVLKKNWKDLNSYSREQIRNEITFAIQHGAAGAECDVKMWAEILQLNPD